MTIDKSKQKQVLESFLEEDLPFLISSHYEDTIVIIKQKLQYSGSSLDILLIQYPNFLTKIRYHLFFWFAHQLDNLQSNNNLDCDENYYTVSMAYRTQYIYSFVQQQLENQTVQQIINFQPTITVS